MFVNWLMDKQNTMYLYSGILFNRRREWSTDTYYNMKKPWKHYAEWKKPNKKGYVMYGSL